MCIIYHTHYSVESVTERGESSPSLSSTCGTCRRVVESSTTHVHWPGPRGSGATHSIIYNIEKDWSETRVVLWKRLLWPGVSSSPPPPPQEKNPQPTPKRTGMNNRPRVQNTPVIGSETTTKRFPHQTQPDVCPWNGPGLPDHPSQSGAQPTHLPLLPHTGVKRPTRRQNPLEDIFSETCRFLIFSFQSSITPILMYKSSL